MKTESDDGLLFRLKRWWYCDRDAVSQESFFEGLIPYLDEVNRKLLIKGYDTPFMEKQETLKAMEGMLERKVKISAIFPIGTKTTIHEMSKKSNLVSVFGIPEEIKDGYILFDEWGTYLWDTERPTRYAPEYGKGVPYRDLIISVEFPFIIPIHSKMSEDFIRTRRGLHAKYPIVK